VRRFSLNVGKASAGLDPGAATFEWSPDFDPGISGRRTIVPTGGKQIRTGMLHSILRDLGLRLDDLR